MTEEKSSPKWYSNAIFGEFWSHYNHCNEWLTENGHQVIQFSDDFDDNYKNIHLNNDNLEDMDSSINNRRVVESKMDELEAIDENECNEETVDSDESELLDISEDYLKFVMQTKRHQLERKRLREKKLRYNDRVEYVDISKIDSFVKKGFAPKKNDKQQDINAKRNQQMHELYGEDSNVIQGMEAALQLNFDRLCDSYQPKFWPIMPIRM